GSTPVPTRRASRSPMPRWLPSTSSPPISTASGTTPSLPGHLTRDALIRAQALSQWDGAAALGLHRPYQLRLVILPQAARIAVAPTVGFLVQLVKATALTSIIGFSELLKTS